MEFEEMYAELGIDKKIVEFSTEIEAGLKNVLKKKTEQPNIIH